MTTKDPKSQTEVWEWKEKASDELLKIPQGNRMQYLADKTAAIIAKLNLRKAKLKPVIR
jgi:hypothetical protein